MDIQGLEICAANLGELSGSFDYLDAIWTFFCRGKGYRNVNDIYDYELRIDITESIYEAIGILENPERGYIGIIIAQNWKI